jgi:hypothetical protein
MLFKACFLKIYTGRRYGLGYIQLAAGVLLLVPLGPYAALTLPPLFILTILYLFGVGWRENRDSEQ